MGRLDVIATPIGNLADLSPRAREALAAADLVAAEDTRRTGALLRGLGLSVRLLSLHDYNETARLAPLLDELRLGKVVALVSDAGTPLLSDPGFALVRAAVAAGVAVRPIPGPSALTATLSVAGLPVERFAFEGFLPARPAARRAVLAQLASEPRTLVFFEAPHRIAVTLEDMAQLLGAERKAVVGRELTKLHETIHRGSLRELAASARTDANLRRGEITLLVEGSPAAGGAAALSRAAAALLAHALQLLLPELPPARAAAIAAQLAQVPRSEAYRLAQRLSERARDVPEPDEQRGEQEREQEPRPPPSGRD
jgi:16S rRNA (cytidine1402-2'-O)-methyltransferase